MLFKGVVEVDDLRKPAQSEPQSWADAQWRGRSAQGRGQRWGDRTKRPQNCSNILLTRGDDIDIGRKVRHGGPNSGLNPRNVLMSGRYDKDTWCMIRDITLISLLSAACPSLQIC